MKEPATLAGRDLLNLPVPPLRGMDRLRFLDDILGIEAEAREQGRREAQAAGDPALREAIDTEIKRLWALAYKYNQSGEGSIGLLIDMTNVIGGWDSFRALLAAAPQPAAAPSNAEIDRMARLLMAEWERVEGPLVGTSYVATFADLARVALGQPAAAPRETAEWAELAKDIRKVDGNHDLGAGELAERLVHLGWHLVGWVAPAAASAELADER